MQNMQVMPYTLSFDICLALDLLYTTSCVVCQAPAICTPHHVYSPVLCWHPVCTGGAMAPFFVDQHWLQDLSVLACLERCTLSRHAAIEVLKTVKSSLRVYPAITVLLHMPKWHKKQKHWHPLKGAERNAETRAAFCNPSCMRQPCCACRRVPSQTACQSAALILRQQRERRKQRAARSLIRRPLGVLGGSRRRGPRGAPAMACWNSWLRPRTLLWPRIAAQHAAPVTPPRQALISPTPHARGVAGLSRFRVKSWEEHIDRTKQSPTAAVQSAQASITQTQPT